jgi:hypothetical protein
MVNIIDLMVDERLRNTTARAVDLDRLGAGAR